MKKIDKQEHSLALEPEYEHKPVPSSHRKSLFSVVGVWFGFPMVLSNAVFGGVIVASLGFYRGLTAILVGNLVLALYVGLLSYRAGATGLNFAMIAQQTFGRRGYMVVSGLLATVVVGWFAFQVGLTGATMNSSFGSNAIVMDLIAGLLYAGITYIGIKALSIVGWIAAPLYIVMGVTAIVFALHNSSWHNILNYKSHIGGGALTFGAAITVVIAGFSDSGTMTPDFTRWAKNGRHGVIAALSAFPIANMISMVVGGLVVAAGGIAEPLKNGGDFMMLLAGHGLFLVVLSIFFIFTNLGSVCAHCLYNGAVGWSHITGSTMRKLTIVLGLIGIVAAVAGVWSLFLNWLNFLGFVVPPIGAILITDQIFLKKAASSGSDLAAWRPLSFIAWGTGSAMAFIAQYTDPQLSEAVIGLITAGITYTILIKVFKRSSIGVGVINDNALTDSLDSTI